MKLCIKNFFIDKIQFCGTFKSTLTPMVYTSFSAFPPLEQEIRARFYLSRDILAPDKRIFPK